MDDNIEEDIEVAADVCKDYMREGIDTMQNVAVENTDNDHEHLFVTVKSLMESMIDGLETTIKKQVDKDEEK